MKLRPFLRPLFECDGRALRKLAVNMCWRSFCGMREFAKRQRKILESGKGDFFPAFLMISISDRCNYRCKGCWVSQNSRELSVEEICKIVKAANEKGSYFFGLLGGEPLMHKGLLEVLRRNPKSYFQIFTNGSLLTRDFAKSLRRLGNATPLISLEGAEAESAERRGVKSAYQRALEAMRACAQEKLFWGVATSVCKNNFADTVNSGHLKFLSTLGAHYMWYYIYRPVGANPSPELALDKAEIRRLREFLVDARQSADLIVIDAYWDDLGRAICPAASGLSHHISPGGHLEFCPPIQFARERFDASRNLAGLFSNSEFLRAMRKVCAGDSRGCILMENPQLLLKTVDSFNAEDSSGRGSARAELARSCVLPSHDMSGDEIPERGFIYKFLKRRYFFGFGAYG